MYLYYSQFFLNFWFFIYKKRDLPFLSAFFIMSSTCALVGFWPRALSMEPSSSTDMVPSLFLSNISKHSISSTQKEREKNLHVWVYGWKSFILRNIIEDIHCTCTIFKQVICIKYLEWSDDNLPVFMTLVDTINNNLIIHVWTVRAYFWNMISHLKVLKIIYNSFCFSFKKSIVLFWCQEERVVGKMVLD